MSLNLPTLTLEAKAELLSNNLPAFEEAFRDGLDSLKYELLEESDFAKAKEDIKALKEAETVCKAMNEAILNGSADLKDAREILEKLAEEARQMRLSREKEVKSRDAEIKAGYVHAALDSISFQLPTATQRIETAMKGKKTFPTLEKAALDEAKKIQSEIDAVDAALETFDESLRHGRNDLLLKSPDAVVAIMEQRKAAQEAAIREAKLKEEADKLKAEAIAKQKAEREAELKNRVQEEKASQEEEAKSSGVAPEPFGPPPKIDNIPVSSATPETEEAAAETSSEELARFKATVIESLAPVKAAREALKHQENIKIGEEFAEAFMVGFRKLN